MAVISLQIDKNIASIIIDNPPVNALSNGVRAGLLDAAQQLKNRHDIEYVIITGAINQGKIGKFIAGADIGEMSLPPAQPFLPDVVDAIANLKQITIAAIDGAALGGGLEIALACDWRFVTPKARLGLPETRLGIIPGSGGTQRLPRLIGLEKAFAMIGNGEIIKADEAVTIGLADKVFSDNDFIAAVKNFIQDNSQKLTKRPTSAMTNFEANSGSREGLDALKAQIVKKAKGVSAVAQSLDVIEKGSQFDFADGVKLEREVFLNLRQSFEAAALRHLFFAERAAGKLSKSDNIAPLELKNIAVIGAGTMGSAIAVALTKGNYSIAVVEMNEEAAQKGAIRIDDLFMQSQKKGQLSEEQRHAKRAKITVTSNWDILKNADLVIEAAFEDIEVKRDIFAKLDALCPAHALLTSNTSYLDLDEIASFTKRPENVLGLHFFSPAHIMKLLEIVRGVKTSNTALLTALDLAKKIGKIAVIAGNCDGFIGNRIYAVYRRHAEYLIADGASPLAVDRALEKFGFAMGIFTVSDLSGLDIAYAMRKRRAATRNPNERYVPIADWLCEMGRLGRKTKGGWYDYDENGKRQPSKIVNDLIEKYRREQGIIAKDFSDEDIVLRLIAVMVNEAAKELQEGIAARSTDIDLAFVNGYGFPRLKGGPIFYADYVGLPKIYDAVLTAYEVGGAGNEPADLLTKIVKDQDKTAQKLQDF